MPMSTSFLPIFIYVSLLKLKLSPFNKGLFTSFWSLYFFEAWLHYLKMSLLIEQPFQKVSL